MATPFKLKSGNTSAFKNLGSSPAKQVEGNLNMTGSKASTTPGYSTTKAAKTENFRKAADKIKTVSSKTNIGTKVVDALTKPGVKDAGTLSLGPKNSLKSEVSRGVKQFVESAKGQMKGLNPPKVSSKIVKVASEAGKVARFVTKAASFATIPLTLYDFHQSGQKHSSGKVNVNQKSFMADAKKNQTSIMKEGKKTKSILNKGKKTKSILNKKK